MSHWLIYRTFWELTVSGIVLGLIYSLVALGYTMVYGVLGLINFAHSDVFMLGAYVGIFTAAGFGIVSTSQSASNPLVFLACVFAAMAACARKPVEGVVPTDPAGPPDLEALRSWCRERIADYKAPDRLVLVESLPVTSMLKVDKRALAARMDEEP